MTKTYKYFVWFFMLTKRLLHQWSFILLLCLIPGSILLTNLAMTNESGVVHIALCHEGSDEKAHKIINSLLNGDSVIRFSVYDSSDVAQDAVAKHEADAAWVFAADFSKTLDNYIAHPGSAEPFVKIIQRENSIPLGIAKEKLFSSIYKDLSFSIYKNFVYSELVSEESVPLQIVEKYYHSTQKGGNIVQIERLDEKATPRTKSNYLTAPIRGILSLMIVLCTLAAAMCFLKEQALGKFAWLPVTKRIIPALASCISASCISAIAVFFTIQFLGISTGVLNELYSILMFVVSTTGFCMIFATLFRSAGKLGAVIPGIMITMLVLSPIFFNMKVLRPVRLMLPTYYYLQSIYDARYYVYTIIYCVVIYSIGFVLNKLLAEHKFHDSNII